jgi:unsaturated rhamnogalacturonyl hydrolase
MKLSPAIVRGAGRCLLGVLPLLAACASAPPVATLPAKFQDATPLEWSVRMANSEMARLPAQPKWDYTNSLLALSLLKLGERTGDPAYAAYAQKVVLDCINANGVIAGYRPAEYQLDGIAPGKVVLAFYQKNPEPRLLTALHALRQQLATQPRTASGGFWHKQVYPDQMWLDGIFMAAPFYAQYGRDFMEMKDFDDVAKQILLVGEHTYDPKTGLFYHGWDESKTQFWANKETGLSPNFWGRAVGWYAMGIVDTLEFLPLEQPQRAQLIELLHRLAAGVARWQDPKTGVWWQVLDQGNRPGNYLEATASCQFVCALAKAVNHGYLPREKYLGVIERGYAGILREFVTTDAAGRLSLTKCCSVAGLGPANNPKRNGTFEYYISEPVVNNDLKGIGPFILAGLELESLAGNASSNKIP